jgi:CSLREA domain-containing protein
VAAIAVALIALAVGPGTAAPQIPGGNIVVDTTKDGNDGECAKDCTIREAIALADINTGRWVQIPPGVYKLTLGPLVIGNDVVFGTGFGGNQSAGARTTVIDARGASRVVQVAANSSAVVAGLTLTGGGGVTAGGGALVPSGGQLSLYDVIVDENVAIARGGGIDNQGNLSLFHTTVSGNRVNDGSGGGVANEANSNTAIYYSTISGNRATANGGGIVSAASLSVQNSTIASNAAGAGGGLYQESTPSASTLLMNTILGANTGGSCGGSIAGVPRSVTSHNLAADGTCLFATPTEGTVGDPRLASLANNGGPTDTHALRAGSPAINNADPQLCPAGSGTDQRYATAVGACDIGAFEFGGKPPQPQVPPPVAGETVNVFTKSGTVRVRLPGSDEYFDLNDVQQIPVGSTIDTTKGKVTFQAAGKSKAWFYKGLFKFRQPHGKKPLTTLSLTGKLQCGGSGKATAAAKKKKRRLWGDGKGKFRTKGKHSAATVVGTKWFVEDRCNGTLTRVKRGVVKVRDFKKRKTITVRAPRSYFAKR